MRLRERRGYQAHQHRILRHLDILSQYFPEGVSMKDVTKNDLDVVAARLNSRPRQTLGFDTPADRLKALLH